MYASSHEWIMRGMSNYIGACDYGETETNMVDRFIQHLQTGGFVREKEITFPHKQSWFGRLRRENWDGPAL